MSICDPDRRIFGIEQVFILGCGRARWWQITGFVSGSQRKLWRGSLRLTPQCGLRSGGRGCPPPLVPRPEAQELIRGHRLRLVSVLRESAQHLHALSGLSARSRDWHPGHCRAPLRRHPARHVRPRLPRRRPWCSPFRPFRPSSGIGRVCLQCGRETGSGLRSGLPRPSQPSSRSLRRTASVLPACFRLCSCFSSTASVSATSSPACLAASAIAAGLARDGVGKTAALKIKALRYALNGQTLIFQPMGQIARIVRHGIGDRFDPQPLIGEGIAGGFPETTGSQWPSD